MTQGAEGTFLTLGRKEYAELVGSVVSLRKLALDLVDVFERTAGASNDATRGANEVVAAIDRALDLLRYSGER